MRPERSIVVGQPHLHSTPCCCERCLMSVPWMASSLPTWLPLASTLISGPVQVQSKKTLMTMLADVAWKERVKVGCWKDLLRREALMKRLLVRCRAAVVVEREENILLRKEGHFRSSRRGAGGAG